MFETGYLLGLVDTSCVVTSCTLIANLYYCHVGSIGGNWLLCMTHHMLSVCSGGFILRCTQALLFPKNNVLCYLILHMPTIGNIEMCVTCGVMPSSME